MSLTLQQLTAIFKDFGKILYLGQAADAQVGVLEDYCLKVVGQAAANADSGNDYSFNLLVNFQTPFLVGIQTVIAQEQAIPNLVKVATDNYLAQIANDIGASGVILDASTTAGLLRQAMVNGSGSVMTWVDQDQWHSFYQYFLTNYQVELPQSGTPTFPDSWIEVTII